MSWQPLRGAAATIEWLRKQGTAFRLVTNTSSRSRRQIAARHAICPTGLPPDHVFDDIGRLPDLLRELPGAQEPSDR